MSTRATITVSDERDTFHIYKHHDGYPEGPHGLVRHLAMAPRLAWELARFEAMDFAAAVVAVLKDRGGSTYLTENAAGHTDRAYHYHIEPVRDGVSTQVQLTITQPSWRDDVAARALFKGSLLEAAGKFNATPKKPNSPREDQILKNAEGALYRAQEEISALCGERPDPDTMKVHEDIEAACRDLMQLRQHLEALSPWQALKQAGDKSIQAKMAWDAHTRFQR